MSRLANEALDDPTFDFRAEDDMFDAACELGRLRAQADANDVEIQHVQAMNPLGLVASDLEAVGWDSDETAQTWHHAKHGAHTFLGACRIEANVVYGDPAEVEDF